MPKSRTSVGTYRLRNYARSDANQICLINDAEIPKVTLISPVELQGLADQAFYFRIAESNSGQIAGFLLALEETANYSSLNFQWFKARYPRFIYIDRIVISAHCQGQGIGRLLYSDLTNLAQKKSPLLTCEVNVRPPNLRSLRFHHEFGFSEEGRQETEGGKKTVALMIKSS